MGIQCGNQDALIYVLKRSASHIVATLPDHIPPKVDEKIPIICKLRGDRDGRRFQLRLFFFSHEKNSFFRHERRTPRSSNNGKKKNKRWKKEKN